MSVSSLISYLTFFSSTDLICLNTYKISKPTAITSKNILGNILEYFSISNKSSSVIKLNVYELKSTKVTKIPPNKPTRIAPIVEASATNLS